ncbi:unnamed protein product [Porites lobata]|uniref:ALOG domain-containing protein n=1 Tax=Porites lobata TaxID=104759 RepID=A0ABN8QKT8_9CNID|nr:unnamed protein product [Porites lobata]
MSLDSNVQFDEKGVPLRHFTPFYTPMSSGINVFAQVISRDENAYVFPPFVMMGPLLKFLLQARFTVTIIAPQLSPIPYWWPILKGASSVSLLLGSKGEGGVILFPSPHVCFATRPLQWDLFAFRFEPREVVIQPKKPFAIDISKINKRVEELNAVREQKPYERQKTALEVELSGFLASLPFAKTLKSATAHDIIKFLVWKDKSGRTKVHTVTCSHMGQGQGSSCKCPCRLAAGTVDSLIGKLRAIFISAGMGGVWDDNLGTGNPASHRSVKACLQAVKEEQARARVRPKKATPLFLDKLQQISQFIVSSMRKLDNSPIDLYLLGRDLCFFSVDFFAGDRSSDLGRTLGKELLYFPDKSGILFNHTFGKTLRGDALNTFSIRRCENLDICPVYNFERYMSICKLLKVDLRSGFLFRSTKGSSVTAEPFLGSAVYNRLKFYLGALGLDSGETTHSLRAGCSITLSLLGVPEGAILKHIGWRSASMLHHFTDLREVTRPDSPGAVLAASSAKSVSAGVLAAYNSYDDLSLFTSPLV